MSVISTQGFTFRLMAGDPATQLDLFQDEDYILSNNVTGLFDIGLLPADFTRQITLPGTKVNNAFFEHCYDISIDNPFIFATNQKVPAYFEFDSVYLSDGYLQLNKVNVVANKFVDNYEVTIFGSLSSFGRDINRYFLTDLTNLDVYNHTSSYDNIVSSWSGSLFDGDIVYPFADYGTGWTFNNTRNLTGINSNEGAVCIQDFKPAIRVKAVWDKIFEFTGYTYSSSFMNEPWISDMYMVCNNKLRYPIYNNLELETYGLAKISAIPSSSGQAGNCDLNLPDNTIVQLPWYNVQLDPQNFVGNNSSYLVEKNTKLQGVLNIEVNVSCSANNLPSRWELHYWPTGSTPTGPGSSYSVIPNFSSFFDQTVQSRNGSINQSYSLQTQFYTGTLAPGNYYFGLLQQKYYSSGAGTPVVTLDPGNNSKSYLSIDKVRQAGDGENIVIQNNMPFGTQGIKLVDFITSIQKKFNLVIYPNKHNSQEFIIETFNNWYQKGGVKDFNKYINLDSNIEVIPANNLAVNKLSFGPTLDTDYVSQQFYKGANREYAKQYYTDTTNYYSQGSLDVKTTFASSPLIYVSGTGLSGSVDGFNPTINSTQWALGGQGYNFPSSNAACNGVYYYPAAVYTAESNAFDITQFYTDANLTTPFNGTGYYYKFYLASGGGTYYSTDITYGGYIGALVYQC